MSSLKDLGLKRSYDGENHHLLNEFYVPALSVAASYDRAVGFFSAFALAEASHGISALAKNQGKMRLVIGHSLEPDEYDAIEKGKELRHVYETLTEKLATLLEKPSSGLAKYRLDLLCWMTAIGALEIKFAFRRLGMFHQKIGIVTDHEGNKVVFQGSANESLNALLPDRNDECLSVFYSWQPEIFEGYGQPFIDKFERLWANKSKNNLVFDVPSEFYDRLRSKAANFQAAPDLEIEIDLSLEISEFLLSRATPSVPKVLGGEPFGLRPHQIDALRSWASASYQGILEHATGSGKTITAIYGATKIFEAKKKLFLVIAVPYQALADQWVEQLRLFGYSPIRCYVARKNWEDQLQQAIQSMNTGIRDVVSIVAVNATLVSDRFQSCIENIDIEIKTKAALFVGDECHHHASAAVVSKLPEWSFRLGLSATPFSTNQESNEFLAKYYGDSVSEYSLERALVDGVLTPYEYQFVIVELTEEETDRYEELSAGIAVQESLKSNGQAFDSKLLLNLYMCRARLIGSASQKFEALKGLLRDRPVEKKSLFYCGDGFVEPEDDSEAKRNISLVSQQISRLGWKSSRFTAEESLKERREILSAFTQDFLDALVAIRVLDEGIDIPGCQNAFIMASSRNPRQFIQRRGRVLRRAPGKQFSRIFDFVVMPCRSGSVSLKNLVRSELQRANEFARLARNVAQLSPQINKLSESWDIEQDELMINTREVVDGLPGEE